MRCSMNKGINEAHKQLWDKNDKVKWVKVYISFDIFLFIFIVCVLALLHKALKISKACFLFFFTTFF